MDDAVMARRRGWLVFLAAMLVWPLIGPTTTAADASTPPTVHSLSPMPSEIITAGEAVVTARVTPASSIRSVTVTINGATAPSELDASSTGDEAQVRAPTVLEPGEHEIVVTVVDEQGQRTRRAWRMTATDRSTPRLAGATRLETAVAISAAAYREDASAAAAVLARADEFADALAGAPLAAAVDGPLLLTESRSLPEVTSAELRRVLPAGATVHILGGTTAISDGVVDAVEALGFATRRHGGSDRYETAAILAGQLPEATTAVLASGVSFPDALTASAPAARDGTPVLLTAPSALPESTRAALAGRRFGAVMIVGGTAAVSSEVADDVAALADTSERIAGADRYATAAAVLDRFFDSPRTLSLASGTSFPDALTGSRHAAVLGQPLLLSDPARLPEPTATTVARLQPDRIDVYGGPAAISEFLARAVLRRAVDGPNGRYATGSVPAALTTVGWLDGVTVQLDRPVNPEDAQIYLAIGDREVRGRVDGGDPATTLRFELLDGAPTVPFDTAHDGRLTIEAVGDGQRIRDEVAFTFLQPDPVFATAGGVLLHLPSRDVEMIGFHESNHDGAQQQQARDTATPKMTLPSRHRGNGSRTSADIVASPDAPVFAPTTGRVIRAGSYVLYCNYTDHYAVIEPDARPGWEVKVLHFRGLRVQTGDRVVAGETIIGDAPRVLPFRSQVDEFSADRNWPHLHVEVVDPSIPDRPGRGC